MIKCKALLRCSDTLFGVDRMNRETAAMRLNTQQEEPHTRTCQDTKVDRFLKCITDACDVIFTINFLLEWTSPCWF